MKYYPHQLNAKRFLKGLVSGIVPSDMKFPKRLEANMQLIIDVTCHERVTFVDNSKLGATWKLITKSKVTTTGFSRFAELFLSALCFDLYIDNLAIPDDKKAIVISQYFLGALTMVSRDLGDMLCSKYDDTKPGYADVVRHKAINYNDHHEAITIGAQAKMNSSIEASNKGASEAVDTLLDNRLTALPKNEPTVKTGEWLPVKNELPETLLVPDTLINDEDEPPLEFTGPQQPIETTTSCDMESISDGWDEIPLENTVEKLDYDRDHSNETVQKLIEQSEQQRDTKLTLDTTEVDPNAMDNLVKANTGRKDEIIKFRTNNSDYSPEANAVLNKGLSSVAKLKAEKPVENNALAEALGINNEVPKVDPSSFYSSPVESLDDVHNFDIMSALDAVDGSLPQDDGFAAKATELENMFEDDAEILSEELKQDLLDNNMGRPEDLVDYSVPDITVETDDDLMLRLNGILDDTLDNSDEPALGEILNMKSEKSPGVGISCESIFTPVTAETDQALIDFVAGKDCPGFGGDGKFAIEDCPDGRVMLIDRKGTPLTLLMGHLMLMPEMPEINYIRVNMMYKEAGISTNYETPQVTYLKSVMGFDYRMLSNTSIERYATDMGIDGSIDEKRLAVEISLYKHGVLDPMYFDNAYFDNNGMFTTSFSGEEAYGIEDAIRTGKIYGGKYGLIKCEVENPEYLNTKTYANIKLKMDSVKLHLEALIQCGKVIGNLDADMIRKALTDRDNGVKRYVVEGGSAEMPDEITFEPIIDNKVEIPDTKINLKETEMSSNITVERLDSAGYNTVSYQVKDIDDGNQVWILGPKEKENMPLFHTLICKAHTDVEPPVSLTPLIQAAFVDYVKSMEVKVKPVITCFQTTDGRAMFMPEDFVQSDYSRAKKDGSYIYEVSGLPILVGLDGKVLTITTEHRLLNGIMDDNWVKAMVETYRHECDYIAHMKLFQHLEREYASATDAKNAEWGKIFNCCFSRYDDFIRVDMLDFHEEIGQIDGEIGEQYLANHWYNVNAGKNIYTLVKDGTRTVQFSGHVKKDAEGRPIDSEAIKDIRASVEAGKLAREKATAIEMTVSVKADLFIELSEGEVVPAVFKGKGLSALKEFTFEGLLNTPEYESTIVLITQDNQIKEVVLRKDKVEEVLMRYSDYALPEFFAKLLPDEGTVEKVMKSEPQHPFNFEVKTYRKSEGTVSSSIAEIISKVESDTLEVTSNTLVTPLESIDPEKQGQTIKVIKDFNDLNFNDSIGKRSSKLVYLASKLTDPNPDLASVVTNLAADILASAQKSIGLPVQEMTGDISSHFSQVTETAKVTGKLQDFFLRLTALSDSLKVSFDSETNSVILKESIPVLDARVEIGEEGFVNPNTNPVDYKIISNGLHSLTGFYKSLYVTSGENTVLEVYRKHSEDGKGSAGIFVDSVHKRFK